MLYAYHFESIHPGGVPGRSNVQAGIIRPLPQTSARGAEAQSLFPPSRYPNLRLKMRERPARNGPAKGLSNQVQPLRPGIADARKPGASLTLMFRAHQQEIGIDFALHPGCRC